MKIKIAVSILCAILFAGVARAAEPNVTLQDFKLVGDLNGDIAAFTLTATAKVEGGNGASLELLSGPVALTEIGAHPKWQVQSQDGKFILSFDRDGTFPVQIKFNAAVTQSNDWRAVNFHVASSATQPLVLRGLAADTEFQFTDAARPERDGTNFVSYLPVDGTVEFSWRQAQPETEGKLFYAADMASQITVSPGLMRQAALFNGKIMQGEMSRVVLILHGDGEVTRVQGDSVLAWNVEPMTNSSDRKLVIDFNQPQKDSFAMLVQTQTPLGAFPQTADAMQIVPENATRFSGNFRIMNDGAVRLEIVQASGLSQISPDQFPEGHVAASSSVAVLTIQRAIYAATDGSGESDVTAKLSELAHDGQIVLGVSNDALGGDPAPYHAKELRVDYTLDGTAGHVVVKESEMLRLPATAAAPNIFQATSSQQFAYRFSSADFALKIQADQILPEVAVSHLLTYNFGENEQAIDDELELDIREAPLRELILNIPRGYAIAKLNAADLSDYFVTEPDGESNAELRLVYGQPISDRQVIQLRLERNQALGGTNWALPRIEVAKAKSVRGFVGVSADSGFRLTTERTQSLTEIAAAFFPGQLANIQSAFRLSDANWQATMRVERLPQTVQADVLHLFSIGEGIAYGSSVMNYAISGAPVSAFRVELSDEYFNVEFTGKDIRGWEKTTNGYVVQLHTPVSGAYTLLATYERPFKSQGETLTFTGARPLDAQTESGHTIVTSAYQFQVTPANVSPGLLALEPGEVPAEYRLFFDAPILAAYRYSSRPFDLKLTLSPLAQGDSLSQVVDRASLNTRISKEGQVLTDAHYFLKNRGNPNFKITLPDETELWSANVNDAPVVPVTDGKSNLIPLPQTADPDAVLKIDLKLASRSQDAERVTVAAPIVSAPVMLAQWKFEPDDGQRLIFENGSLTPIAGIMDNSGFAQLEKIFRGDEIGRALKSIFCALILLISAIVVWQWAYREDVYKFSVRHIAGFLIGLVAIALAAISLVNLAGLANNEKTFTPSDISFLAPVQQAETAFSVQIENVPATTSTVGFIGGAWPFIFALAIWMYGRTQIDRATKMTSWILGWTLLAWATLRLPNSAPAFLLVVAIFIFIYVIVPALKQLWRAPTKPTLSSESGAAPVVATVLIGLLWLGNLSNSSAQNSAQLAESVTQQIQIEDQFAIATAKIHWQAQRGDTLPLLSEPAVLTHINFPKALNLVQTTDGSQRVQELVAQRGGVFDVELQYQIQVTKYESGNGFTLPVQGGLINKATVTLLGLDVDVVSPQAVSVQRETSGTNTVATLVLMPGSAWIGWEPRSRDVKNEKPEFYAEISQLYVPSAGVIEGAHYVSIRPAQGELSELVFDVPRGATITDVLDPSQNSTSLVSLWRFDPDTRKLRVTLNHAQSKPFGIIIRSQVATGTLPFEQSVGLISVDGAAGQIGSLGIATGDEVQLDDVHAENFSAINLEDFPDGITQTLAPQFPGLTVRRAFRYADSSAVASIKASAVEPDVRVETQDTLSLGEDRTLLASTADVTITRAGIFKLSFVMPTNFDVESISGAALSHWTELKTDAGRVITLNLTGKTEGEQQFNISLSGPGMKTASAWMVPQIILREASKQRGSLVVVPEQGMRLQIASRNGVTQLDPQKSGITEKGVLAFRILQTPWNLALDVEQVDPWIQVTSLQAATIAEAQIKIAANLQYQIENAGIKSFSVLIPTNAEGVTFSGDQVGDFLPVADAVTNGLQRWEVKLRRRIIGEYFLQANYQVVMPPLSAGTVLRGVQAADVNLQRGFVTVQSGGRLQLQVDKIPESLQPVEWQSIPRVLQQNLQTMSANFSYRLVEPDFQLPLKLERHEAAKLLPARVNQVTFTSVISDAGAMLTRMQMEILPGDKRLLHLTLPPDANFWFAFVNQNGVWPWRQGDEILIPLEQQSRGDRPATVELFFSSQVGKANSTALNLNLLAPKFDLPLENITWRVFLNDKWQVKHWNGALQLQQQEIAANGGVLNLQSYLQSESSLQQQKSQEAEQMLALGNSALENGDPQQARRAFESAYGLSRNDAAFNEDARVELNNIKLQQALVGLNVRQATVAGDNDAFRKLRDGKDANYTQQDAKEIIDRNTADDNDAFMKLAERIVQQQDAAVTAPAVIRANIPEQGRLLTFKRAVVVDTWANLNIGLKASAASAVSWSARFSILLVTAILFVVLGLLARSSANSRA